MTVTIEDAEFDQAVKELAAVTGEPEDVLLKVAVRERLDRVTRGERGKMEPAQKPSVEELRELIHSFAAGPVNYDVSEDEILGYGPNGYCD